MSIPVFPFLMVLAMLMAAAFLWIMDPYSWPMMLTAAAYFLYCGHREIWHNGEPLVVGRRR